MLFWKKEFVAIAKKMERLFSNTCETVQVIELNILGNTTVLICFTNVYISVLV